MGNLYQAIDVWKRQDEKTLVRYRCFRILSTNRFCVQSADFYRLPFDQKQVLQLDDQFLELLVEESPEQGGESFESLEAAIEAHDRNFADVIG